MFVKLVTKLLLASLFIATAVFALSRFQGLQPGNNNGGSAFVFPTTYPPTSGSTDVWNWGQATGNYTSAVLADTYIAGSGGTPGHQYDQAGPPSTTMKAAYWRNDGSFNSHHTAPLTAVGQSLGPVNAAMQPGTSSFKFYFMLRKPLSGLENFYYFFDYDQQNDAVTFNQGMQFFVSAAGLFSTCSIVVLLKDSTAQFGQYHAKTLNNRLCGDDKWHLVELVFDRGQSLPNFYIDGEQLAAINTFSGPALSALTTILPTAGVRFGMREYSETAAGRSDLYMAAAAYAKSLTYTWR